jgi:hypothetical protein
MSSKLTLPAIAFVVFGGLAAASAGFAQNAPTAKPAPQGQGMMGGQQGQGMMGGEQGQGMMNMMGQMTRMMENCNRMMESANLNPANPTKPPAQTPPG